MNKRYLLLILLLAASATLYSQNRPGNRGAGSPTEVINAYEALEFMGMPYRFLLPENYDSQKKYPLILSLHGGAGVGDDNESQMRNWTEVFVDKVWRKKYPCVVIAPQSRSSWSLFNERIPELPPEKISGFSPGWRSRFESGRYSPDTISTGSLTMAFFLVDKIARDYSIDTKRIYVMGHSMGGAGTWNAIWAEPDKFAAAIPSAGGLLPFKDKSSLKKTPIWAFHGDIDNVVPFDFSSSIFDAMKEAKGNMKFTVLKDVKHNASDYTFYYEGDDLKKGYITQQSSELCDPTPSVWDWLFKQRIE